MGSVHLSLTKKHFEELAEGFREFKKDYPSGQSRLFWMLADFCARHNAYFDLEKFSKACDYQFNPSNDTGTAHSRERT